MNRKEVYSSKAKKYSRYRWDYAAQAIQEIFDTANISAESVVADLGAGTGILTRHFIGKVRRIYAIEPNPEMRQVAKEAFLSSPSCIVKEGCAEETTLADGEVDLITVAQAIHWFSPEPANTEIHRILKKEGWLGILRNYGTNETINDEITRLSVSEYGVNPIPRSLQTKNIPMSYYYGHNHFERKTFPFQFQQSWEEFIGSITSASYMPDENHPLYAKMENAARNIFRKLSQNGQLEVQGETELYIGQPI
jgi:ubiquinone/menaquinone biosynthesis C-methylase UbiE